METTYPELDEIREQLSREMSEEEQNEPISKHEMSRMKYCSRKLIKRGNDELKELGHLGLFLASEKPHAINRYAFNQIERVYQALPPKGESRKMMALLGDVIELIEINLDKEIEENLQEYGLYATEEEDLLEFVAEGALQDDEIFRKLEKLAAYLGEKILDDKLRN